nr:integrase, catalytic region, zinc finger, CCHC-type, peptidase aspartic, catalytic [Tanacetum cinerariifolium]
IVKLILFVVDSGCLKHMTGNLKLLCNFVEKYLDTVRFGNDQFAPILGYGDLVQGNIMINKVYYVECLNHNLFSVGQFCYADLEVAFWKSTCFVRDLQGNDLLTDNRGSDLYTISLQESTSSTPLCLMAKASPTQAWLWHQRLSHLNFDYINLLSKKDVVIGLPRGTEFLNKTLNAFFKEEGIEHQTSTARTPEQNGVVERQNHTLVEAAQTMLSASKLPLFFWAEAIAIAFYTQNRSIIIPAHDKMTYHIINDRKPSIKHLYILSCICHLTSDGENLDKMKEKGDPCIMVGYSTQSKGYRVYNKRTRLIVESIHIRLDEIKEMSETVYYVKGLNHNLFSVGQFCDADLKVAFRKSTCFVRDLQGNDLLTGHHGSDLYTISLQESTSLTPLYLMAKASPTQAWLWHRRLSHLNFVGNKMHKGIPTARREFPLAA